MPNNTYKPKTTRNHQNYQLFNSYDMKQFLLFLLIAMTAFQANLQAATDSGPRLIVWMKSGEKVSFNLHEAPITTFQGSQLVIRTNKTTVTYLRKDVLRYTYEQLSTSGVELLADAREVQVNVEGDEVTFRGLKEGTVAQVYEVNGVLVAQQKAVAGHPLTISIKDCPSGVYIVKAATETIKILKK